MHPPPPTGRIVAGLHLFPVRVYYEDTDLSGVVYHANYLRWFERARSDMLRLLGIDQRAAAEAAEGHYAVADIAIRYAAPARLDDAVTIASRATQARAASVVIEQRALRPADTGGEGQDTGGQTRDIADDMLAEATIRVGFVGPEGRPRRQPAAWRETFNTVLFAKDTQ